MKIVNQTGRIIDDRSIIDAIASAFYNGTDAIELDGKIVTIVSAREDDAGETIIEIEVKNV